MIGQPSEDLIRQASKGLGGIDDQALQPKVDEAALQNLEEQEATQQFDISQKQKDVQPVEKLPSPMEAFAAQNGVVQEQALNQRERLLAFRTSQTGRIANLERLAQDNKLPNAVVEKLTQRMQNIDGNLNTLLQRTSAANGTKPDITATGSLSAAQKELPGPIQSFFRFLSNGEVKLMNIEKELTQLSASSKDGMVSPVELLRFQVKMSHVQQQLELFTNTLTKGFESVRSTLNTQI